MKLDPHLPSSKHIIQNIGPETEISRQSVGQPFWCTVIGNGYLEGATAALEKMSIIAK